MAVGLKKGHTYAQIEKKSLIMAGTHSFFPQKPSAHWQNFFAWPLPDHLAEEGIETWIARECRRLVFLCKAFAPCSFQHARERMDVSRSVAQKPQLEGCLSGVYPRQWSSHLWSQWPPGKLPKLRAICHAFATHLPRICHAFATSLGRLERYVGFGWSGRGNSSSREVPPRQNYNTWRHVFPYADADDAGSARVKPHYVTTVVKNMWNVDECCGCTCHVGMREHWLRWQECSFTFFHHFVNPDGRRCLLLMGISQNSPHQTGCAGWIISWISPF